MVIHIAMAKLSTMDCFDNLCNLFQQSLHSYHLESLHFTESETLNHVILIGSQIDIRCLPLKLGTNIVKLTKVYPTFFLHPMNTFSQSKVTRK